MLITLCTVQYNSTFHKIDKICPAHAADFPMQGHSYGLATAVSLAARKSKFGMLVLRPPVYTVVHKIHPIAAYLSRRTYIATRFLSNNYLLPFIVPLTNSNLAVQTNKLFAKAKVIFLSLI